MTETPPRRRLPLAHAVAAAVGLLAAGVPAAGRAATAAPTVEVANYWVAPSEKKALDVYRRAWAALGGRWIDTPAHDRSAELKMVMDRIANGYPPTVMQWNANEGSRELPEMGVIQDIDAVARADHWRKVLPPMVLQAISYQGHVILAPTGIHAENWLWTNRRIFDQLGLTPPATWDAVLTDARKIAAAGYHPIAMGNGPWEVTQLFNGIVYAVYGRAGYLRLMKETDPKAAADPKMIQALTLLKRLRPFVWTDPAKPTWAQATRDVGSGRAAMQFMGDWAKGELLDAGFRVGRDFRCTPAPGTGDAYFLDIDAFAFPLTSRPEDRQAQLTFARMVMTVKNQLAFNALKGSISVRTDVPPEQLDACARVGLDRIMHPDSLVQAQSIAMPTQMSEAWIALVARYFNDPAMTPEAAQARIADILSRR